MWKSIMLVVAMVLMVSAVSNAALIDRGGGLIYDTVLNITWLQDADYAWTSGYWRVNDGSREQSAMTIVQALTWADNLVYYDSVRNVSWSDWRLPKVLPVNGMSYNFPSYNYKDGSTDLLWNISAPGSAYPGSTSHELAYMYYNNLGGKGSFDVNGQPQSNYGVQNPGPFINLMDNYWSGTAISPSLLPSWWGPTSEYTMDWYFDFSFDIGWEGGGSGLGIGSYAWAVRDGDVAPVPIPGAVWLLGSGIVGLVGARKKLFK